MGKPSRNLSDQEAAAVSAWKAAGRSLDSASLESYERSPEAEVESRFRDAQRRLTTPDKLFVGTPDACSVRQGQKPNCVLTSAVIGLAKQRPGSIQGLLVEQDNQVLLKLPGKEPRAIGRASREDLLEQSCSYQSGQWMTLLSRELGRVGEMEPGSAIEMLTGYPVDGDWLRLQNEQTLRRKLDSAISSHQVVIAGRSGWDHERAGLSRNHSYAVLGYSAVGDSVALQDPAGCEPVDAQGRALDGQLDGRFSLKLPEFKKLFSTIHYEQSEKPQGWWGKVSGWAGGGAVGVSA